MDNNNSIVTEEAQPILDINQDVQTEVHKENPFHTDLITEVNTESYEDSQAKSQVLVQSSARIDDITVEPDTWNVFVGDLVSNVSEEDLHEVFYPCGHIRAINIIRDNRSKQCKGYAFIHFSTKEGQEKAMEEYNGRLIKGRPCRVKLSEHKTVLFVGNIPMDLSEEEVQNSIKQLCEPISTDITVELKTGPPPQKRSRGFCFVTFQSHPVADACKKILCASSISGRQLNVSWAETTFHREVDNETMSKVTTLYVSNLSTTVQEDILRIYFSQFGDIVKCVIVKNPLTGEPRGFAFIQYKDRSSCNDALAILNDSEFAGQRLNVVLAKPPVEGTVRKKPPRRGGLRTNVPSISTTTGLVPMVGVSSPGNMVGGWNTMGVNIGNYGGNTIGSTRGNRRGRNNQGSGENWITGGNMTMTSADLTTGDVGNWGQGTWNWNQGYNTGFGVEYPGIGSYQNQYGFDNFGNYGYVQQGGSRYGPY